jgi:RimJ/RimL family protein N-acetyltransferase
MRLETRGLVLDALTPDDAPAFALIAGHPRVAPMLMIFPSPCPETLALDVIRRSGDASRPGFRLAVREGGVLVGSVGIGGDIPGEGVPVAFFVDPAAQGRGVATEAVTAFVPACFDAFDLPALHADHFNDNPASGVVLRRAGFVEVGRGVGTSAARPAPAPVIRYRRDAARAIS